MARAVHVLGWYFPDSVGGTEVYVHSLASRLCAQGHDVSVSAPEPGASEERIYKHEDITVHRYPVPASPARAEARGERPVRGAEWLHRRFGSLRPEVVHFHNLGFGLGLDEVRAAHDAGARVFVTFHTSGLGWICQRGDLMLYGERPCDGVVDGVRCAACALAARSLPRPLAQLVGRTPSLLARTLVSVPGRAGTLLGMRELISRNLRRQLAVVSLAERVVGLTEKAREILIANGVARDKVLVHRLGTSHSVVVKPVRPTGTPVHVGYLGRFESIKGADDLIAAVRRLPTTVPIALTLRGPADAARVAELRALAGGDPRISIGGPVRPAETAEVLASFDLLCCPSRCMEGGPTVAIEAHAVGTPVVGSALGGIAEWVRDPERLFPPGDVAALARLLLHVANAPDTVDRWRRGPLPVHTMDQVAEETAAMYGWVE